MSILDYTTGLFRDPANLRAFVDDPHQALADAGLPGATPEQVHDLLPLVAESMPPDHPLQDVAHADDPAAALQALDIDDLVADLHDHHREVQQIKKALGGPETVGVQAPIVQCRPDTDDEVVHVVEPASVDILPDLEGDKALAGSVDNPLTPQIEGPFEPADEDPEPDTDEQRAQALDEGDFSAAVWAKTIE
jgi:hypothetical protein